jgi:bifunctional UDP-N-acetylglucosamine pyrophosphorylase / glucosamine-1-phosphate N-acetyltransferase
VTQPRTVIVLALGDDERMRSSRPKVLHPLLGRTLIGHVLAATERLAADRTVVVGSGPVAQQLSETRPDVLTVTVDSQGPARAVAAAVSAAGLGAGGASVVVLDADRPLLRADTVAALVRQHEASGAAATVLTAVADPDRGGGDESVEVAGGGYVFDAAALGRALSVVSTLADPVVISDLVGILVADGRPVAGYEVADADEVLRCDDRVSLAVLRAALRDRVNARWMLEGVTIVDPATTWIDVTASVGRDAVVEPGTQIEGTTSIGEWAVVGPETSLVDAAIGEGAHVVRSHVTGATIGTQASVGPYAYVRPGTVLHTGAKVGTFVEVKNSEVGAGTKIPHLSYVGDATIGEETNIGAANVVVNYDGIAKHRTVVGSHVRTGSDTMLVAPVTVGDGAYTAAGSVVTEDVPPGALAVARSHQRNVEGWVQKRRAGTKSARAAAMAGRGGSGTDGDSAGQTPTYDATGPTHGALSETQAAMSPAASAMDSATGDTSSD